MTLTANDLKLIDSFLKQQQGIINQPEQNKKILHDLRNKICSVLNTIQIKIEETK